MNPEPNGRPAASLQSLVGDAIRDGADLLRQELGLFRAEMKENVGGLLVGLALFLVAAVFAVASLIWLTQAAVYGLTLLTHRDWLSALIVGGVLLLIALAMVIVGKNKLSAAGLIPSRTVGSIKRDSQVLADRVVSERVG